MGSFSEEDIAAMGGTLLNKLKDGINTLLS
jgi:hypothetical protein